MRLLFDIGNTRAKCALYDGPQPVDMGPCTEAFVETLLRHYGSDIECAVASVVGPEPDWGSLLPEGLPLHRISHLSPLPFGIDYKTPGTLGADRLAVLCGAFHKCYPQGYSRLSDYAPIDILVVDAGTCVTIDHLHGNVYRGGIIMPGIQMMLQAMHDHTARLPELRYEGQPVPPLGKSTEECLLGGAVMAIANTINGYCRTLRPPAPMLTGGDAEWLLPLIIKPAEHHKNLLFEGLNSIKL